MRAAWSARWGSPLEEVPPADWNVIIAVNLSAAFFFAQAVAPAMKKARWGRIVNISSGAGLGPSLTGIQAYAAAKAGQINLTRQLCHELGEFNITVNNIAPGFVLSNPSTEKQWASYGEAGQQALLDAHRHEAPGRARRHCPRRPLLRLGLRRMDQRSSPVGGRREVMTGRVLVYLASQHDRILAELATFAAIPSVSTDPAYAGGMAQAAGWVADQLTRAQIEHVQILPTAGHPLVYGDWLHAPGAPTILVYGHYDVQPPDPLDKWLSDPFTPSVRAGRLYGRGVSDDKGPMLIPLKVAEAFMTVTGGLPINVKFVFEGEEEIGSPSLEPFIQEHAARLAADFALSADGAMWRIDEPSLTVSSRGITGLEFTLTGRGQGLAFGTSRWRRSQPAPRHRRAGRVAA